MRTINGVSVLMIEKLIANAHASTMRAAYLAETLRDQTLSDDLHGVAGELRHMGEQILKDYRRVRNSR